MDFKNFYFISNSAGVITSYDVESIPQNSNNIYFNFCGNYTDTAIVKLTIVQANNVTLPTRLVPLTTSTYTVDGTEYRVYTYRMVQDDTKICPSASGTLKLSFLVEDEGEEIVATQEVNLTIVKTATSAVTNTPADTIDSLATQLNSNTADIVEMQNKIDAAIEAGDSNLEVIEARTKADNTIYGTLKDRLNANDTAVAENTADIAANTASIATNTSNIATNTQAIATNAEDIATNTASIAQNTEDIATNAVAIAAVASGSPKGTYATLTDLQTAFPTGDTNIYLVLADGHWYYWNSSAWTDGAVYQPALGGTITTGLVIAPSSVNTLEINNPLTTAAAAYNRIKYTGDVVSYTAGVGKSMAEITAYRNKFYIHDLTNGLPVLIADKNGVDINLLDGSITTEKIADKAITFNKTKYLMAEGEQSKNIFTEWESGNLNYTTGAEEANAAVIRSKGFMEVLPSTAYTVTDPESLGTGAANAQYVFEFDTNKAFIKYTLIYSYPSVNFTTSATTYYIRFKSQTVGTNSYMIGAYSSFLTQVEIGTESTNYTNPNPKIKTGSIGTAQTEYLMAEGSETLNLFNGNVEYGSFNYTTGAAIAATTVIRSKTFIPVTSGDTLTMQVFNATTGFDIQYVFEYDVNKAFISYQVITLVKIGDVYKVAVSLSATTKYIRFRSKTEDGTYTLPELAFYAENVMIESGTIAHEYEGRYPITDTTNIRSKAVTPNKLSEDTLTLINDSLKNYYETEKNRVIAKVYEDIISPSNAVFGVIADIQSNASFDTNANMLENYTNINRLCRDIPVSFIANLGDFIMAMSAKATTLSELKKYASLVFGTSPVPYFIAKGNHDDNSGYTMNNGYLYADLINDVDWYKYVIKYSERYSEIVFDNNNRKGGYCYIDDNSSKIRFIFMNVEDIVYADSGDGTSKYDAMHNPAMQDAQLQWLAHTAFNFSSKTVPRDWATVAFAHNTFGGFVNFNLLLGIITAYKNGTSYDWYSTVTDYESTISVDYTSQGAGEFITFFCGDLHTDSASLEEISTGSGIYKIHTASSHNPDLSGYTRTVGTDTQDLFDIVVIDRENKQIKMTRFGAGEDRVISY